MSVISDNLPKFQLLSNLAKVLSQFDFDVESNLLHNVNFDYYHTCEFSSNSDIIHALSNGALSFLHCNIRSLETNGDGLLSMLSEIQHTFNIIGLSETKINIDKAHLHNFQIPDCFFITTNM